LNKKKIGLIITAYIIAVIATAYPFMLLVQGYGKLDSDSKHLVSTIFVAAAGGSLFALRNNKKISPKILEGIETFELLILIVIPCVEISTYLMKIPAYLLWSMTPFVAGSMIWYLIVLSRHKIYDEPKEEKKFTFSITWILVILLFLASIATWFIISWLAIPKSGA